MQDNQIIQIKEKLKKLGIKTEKSPELGDIKNKEHFSVTGTDKENKRVLFKCSANKENEILKNLENEIYILKKINEFETSNKLILPKLIKSRVSKKFVWHIREFIEGNNFGTWQEGIKKEIGEDLSCAKKLALGIYYLQIKMQTTADEKKISQRKFDAVIKNGKSMAENLFKDSVISEKEKENAIKHLSVSGPQESFVFCHGNIVPENILCNNNSIGLINWKDSKISNPAMDLANVWVFSILYPDWQKQFIDSYMELSSNQQIVEQYLKIEKTYKILHTINRFKIESQIKTIKGAKKIFFEKIKKALVETL
jgi:thiamine kinase-like enzyme